MFRVTLIALFLWAGLFVISEAKSETIGPQQLVEQTTDKVLKAIAERRDELKKDESLVYQLTNQIVVPHFDFISISRWVLGKNWRVASKEQKIRFIKAFRELMVRTYGVALLEYDGNSLSFLPLRDDVSKGDVTVRSEFAQQGKAPVAINYSLHLHKNAWKVYDVSVDGVSIVATFRTSFATEIKQKGLDDLIEQIEQKNTKGKQG